MSVLISHPSVAPFVQQAARSLLEAGELDRFITTLRYDAGSPRQRLAVRVCRLAGFDLETQLRRRTVTELPPSRVESHPWSEVLRLLSGRIDRGGRMTDLVWERTEPAFDRMVSRRIRPGHTAVYGFEYSSLSTFTRARELGVRVAYDMPAPEPRFVQQLLDKEIAQFPELHTAYHRHTAVREERRIARRRAEWNAADLVIAASRFTRDSFGRAGLDIDKVRIVPYGAPVPVPSSEAASGGGAEGEPLRLLWAGTFSIRKGAHYLLDAWRRGQWGRHARLQVCGAVTLPERLLKPSPDGVEFLGSIPRERLFERYRASDALVFPTLCDGYGMVISEAWSRGTPVITTDRAGAADLLNPGVNGITIKPANPDAISEAIDWCLRHRSELRAMRLAALETAARWQWSDYRELLSRTLREAGMFGAA
jgi:glycosyltransferase involved in cell wall biosynthesis